MAAVEEQGAALLGVAERGMAALFRQVIGLGLDDSRGQPVPLVAVADDLAQQRAGEHLGVAVEEAVGQWAWRGDHRSGSW